MKDNIQSALQAIPVEKTEYSQWLHIGMALKNEGYPCTVWDSWSRPDPRYRDGECLQKWDTFRSDVRNPVRAGTIFDIAGRFGWQPDSKNREVKVRSGSGDSTVAGSFASDASLQTAQGAETHGVSLPMAQNNTPGGAQAHKPQDGADAEELIRYLELLFKPEEFVGYVLDAVSDQPGHWRVNGKGNYRQTAGELVSALGKHLSDPGSVIGDWNPAAGGWIHINPLDGKGISNANVTRFTYALVESDTMSLEDQERIYRELKLPIRVLVSSAGKSIHAIVRIDAGNEIEYRSRVDFLYKWLIKHGVDVDQQNKNPSRLSRLPGITRNGRRQRILAENIGCDSWDEWFDLANEESDSMPAIRSMDYYDEHPPKLPEELIEGVLRCGHKMLLAGPSKAGKSFALMELCTAFASGGTWMGFKCKQCKVLYVNLEIDQESGPARILEIYQKLGLDPATKSNISIWNLRGHAMPMDQLTPLLIRKLKGKGFGAFIIDPIYKVIIGDENNASDMGKFCNEFDKVCMETGCAAIYCHHHSKGAQGGKKSMDRASGSGVFARDPDALLDMVELSFSKEERAKLPNPHYTAWRMEGSLREFESFEPVCFWFEYPIHRVDKLSLANRPAEGEVAANLAKSSKRTSSQTRKNNLEDAFAKCNDDGLARISEMADYLEADEKTVRRYVKEFCSEYRLIKGGFVRKNVGNSKSVQEPKPDTP